MFTILALLLVSSVWVLAQYPGSPYGGQPPGASALATTVTDILTSLGLVDGDEDFGTFTGDIIPDSSTADEALQALETAIESGSMDTVEVTTDAVLSNAQVSNSLITNRGWTGGADMTLTLPDADTVVGVGLKFKFLNVVTDAAEDVYIDTEGTTTKIYLDGLPGTDGHRIWLDNPTIGESITCHTATIDGTTYDWFCDSINGIWADKGS